MKELFNLEVQPDEFIPFVGMGEAYFLGGVASKYGVPFTVDQLKDKFFQLYLAKAGEPGVNIGYPGARDLVLACRQAGLKVAVASSADRVKVLPPTSPAPECTHNHLSSPQGIPCCTSPDGSALQASSSTLYAHADAPRRDKGAGAFPIAVLRTLLERTQYMPLGRSCTFFFNTTCTYASRTLCSHHVHT